MLHLYPGPASQPVVPTWAVNRVRMEGGSSGRDCGKGCTIRDQKRGDKPRVSQAAGGRQGMSACLHVSV